MKDRLHNTSFKNSVRENNVRRTRKTVGSYFKKRSLDVHKQWSHDLFNEKKESLLNEETRKKLISNPLFMRLNGLKDVKKEQALESNPLYARMQGFAQGSGQQTVIKGSTQEKTWTIKGVSGATTVIIQNLAEGTSSEDVKISLASLGHIQACSMYQMGHGALVQAEVTFSLRSEANTAVEKLNRAIADGNVLNVFIKER